MSNTTEVQTNGNHGFSNDQVIKKKVMSEPNSMTSTVVRTALLKKTKS